MVEIGIDLREYYPSVEWDILGVPGKRCIMHALTFLLYLFVHGELFQSLLLIIYIF